MKRVHGILCGSYVSLQCNCHSRAYIVRFSTYISYLLFHLSCSFKLDLVNVSSTYSGTPNCSFSLLSCHNHQLAPSKIEIQVMHISTTFNDFFYNVNSFIPVVSHPQAQVRQSAKILWQCIHCPIYIHRVTVVPNSQKRELQQALIVVHAGTYHSYHISRVTKITFNCKTCQI